MKIILSTLMFVKYCIIGALASVLRWHTFLMFVGLSVLNGQTVQPISSSTSSTEALKLFTSTPPVFTEVLFQRNRHFMNPSNASIFLVRWQPNAIFVREVTDMNRLDAAVIEPARKFFGRFDDYYWRSMSAGNSIVTIENSGSKSKDSANPIYVHYVTGIREASPVLNLGINNVAPGTTSWSGNTFQAISVDNQPLKGVLTTSNDAPQSMYYTFPSQGKEYNRLVRYEYSTMEEALPLPTKISVFTVVNGKEEPETTYTILKWGLGASLLDKAKFMPDTYMTEGTTIFEEAKDGLFLVQRNGSKSKVALELTPQLETRKTAWPIRVVLLLVITSGLTVIITMSHRKKQQTTNK